MSLRSQSSLRNVCCALLMITLTGVSFIDPIEQDNRCKYLLAALENKDINAIFGIDRYTDLPIQIIDMKGKFGACELNEVYKRKISITSDTQQIKVKSNSNIIVHDLVKVRNRFRLYLEYKVTGAHGYVELMDKRGR